MTARRLRRRLAVPSLLAIVLLAAGCSKGRQDSAENSAEPTSQQVDVEIPAAPAPEPMLPVAPPPVVNEIALDEEQLSEAQQIQEDADASGMTSRLPPADAEQPSESAPAE